MKKILIIDDDEGIRNLCITLMKRKGYIVATLSGSNKADETIKEFNPDIVLTDHNLGFGEEAGYTLAMRLKERGLKVVLMSADANIGDKAFENNLAFCQKPFRSETLLNTLTEVSHAQ
jgi:DNA-binding NtrC family response regulator